MEELTYKMVQGQIGYEFKNLDLLQQAFIRRSYAKENGGADNEILEFIGDKALDISVVRLLSEKYGHMASEDCKFNSEEEWDEFYCEYSEGKLTEIKMHMVEKKTLAMRIDELGFADFLIMGKGDVQKNISEEASVKEDLFEAIVGAVAIDSNWNFDDIQSVVEIMLEPESFLEDGGDKNYVRMIQEWELKKNDAIPLYKYFKQSYQRRWYIPFEGVSQNINKLGTDITKLQYTCELKLLDNLPIFRGFGISKSDARKAVCEVAYSYLEKNNLLFSIRDEIENPNMDDAINQLEILARRGYFSVPKYNFMETHDNDGNPVWKAECHIEEYDYFYDAESSSKRNAKKSAAFDMLMSVLGYKEADK